VRTSFSDVQTLGGRVSEETPSRTEMRRGSVRPAAESRSMSRQESSRDPLLGEALDSECFPILPQHLSGWPYFGTQPPWCTAGASTFKMETGSAAFQDGRNSNVFRVDA